MKDENEPLFNQMRGEYLGTIASLELNLSLLIVECLNIGNHRDNFEKWFVETPIPYNYKAQLLKSMLKDDVIINTNYPNFWKDLEELQRYRNILAHSFISLSGYQTSRGKKIDTTKIKPEVLRDKLVRLKELENTVLNMYVSLIEGPMPPISSDDYADWPG